jgi:hypothetical protein
MGRGLLAPHQPCAEPGVATAHSASGKEALMPEITLWGFDGSTYVRTVKMLVAEKGVTRFRQEPLNVL